MKKILLLLTFLTSIYSVSYAQCTNTITAGIIGVNQTICAGSFPSTITPLIAPTNAVGTPTYVWQKSPTNVGPFTTISGATSAILTFTPALPFLQDTYIRRIVTDPGTAAPCNTATSNLVHITVLPQLTAGVVTSDQTICTGGDPVAFTQTIAPTGGPGVYTYQWQSAAAASGPWSNISPAATNATYDAPVGLTAITYYRRVDASGTCLSANTNVITITVAPVTLPSVSILANKTVICANDVVTFTATPTNGGIPSYQWSKNAVSIPSATNSTYTTTGSVNGDKYTVQMISSLGCASPSMATSPSITITVIPIATITVTNTPILTNICQNNPVTFTASVSGTGTTPAPSYEWFVTSFNTATGGLSMGAPSTTATTFTTSALTATNNKVYVQVVSNSVCASTAPVASNLVAINVSPGIVSGTIGSDQTICYNTIPATITKITAPTGIVGTPTYQWEASLTGTGPFSNIAGATNATYTPTIPLTQDVYIRRVIIDPATPASCNIATSNTVHITVRPILTAGVIGSDQTICAGAVPASITQIIAPIGGTGIYTFQWQSSTSGTFGSFTNIAGATNQSYSASSLTTTTSYQRIETSGACGSVTSNVVKKTVTAPEVVTVSINDPGTICAGSPIFTFTATANTTGAGALSYQWFLGSTLVGTNSATYNYISAIADNGKIVKAVVTTSTGCNTGPAVSNLVTLNIVAANTPTITISGNPVNCIGLQTTFTATSTGGGLTPTYKWYVKPSGSTFGTPVGTGSTTYTSSSLINGDRVYVELTSSIGCIIGSNPFKSNEIIMNIKPIPTPSINEGDQTICAPNSFMFHGNITAGNSYEWRQLPTNTAIGTSADFTANQSGSYYIYEDNGTCSVASAAVNLTVISTPIANAGPDQNVFASSNVILNASGGSEYSWTPGTYLSNTTIANPTFTADQTITYTVTVSDPSGTCSSTDDVTVHVTNAPLGSFSTSITGPNPVVSGQQNTTYSVPNQTGFTYAWSITGGTIVSGQNTNSVTVNWDASTSHSISIVETNQSNQTKTTTATINTITTAVTQSQAQSGINVFPNPTTSSFNIEMPESGMDVAYEILDLTGLSVARGTFTSTGGDQNINVNLNAGMYQVVLKYNNIFTCVRLSKVQ